MIDFASITYLPETRSKSQSNLLMSFTKFLTPSLAGSFTVRGNIDAEDASLAGMVNIDGDVNCEKFVANVSASNFKNLYGESIIFENTDSLSVNTNVDEIDDDIDGSKEKDCEFTIPLVKTDNAGHIIGYSTKTIYIDINYSVYFF